MSAMSQSLSSTEPDTSSQVSMEDSLEDIHKEALDVAEMITNDLPYPVISNDLPTPVATVDSTTVPNENENENQNHNHVDNHETAEEANKPVKSKIPQPNAKLNKRVNSCDVVSNGGLQPQRSSLQRRRSDEGSRDSLSRGSTPCTANGMTINHGVHQEETVKPQRGNQAILKETITSRRRREMAHNAHHRLPEEDENDYLTPLQRKDKLIRFMKDECRRLAVLVQEREDLLEAYEEDRERDIKRAVAEKDEDVVTLSEQLGNLRTGYDELMTSHEEAIKTAHSLEETVKDLKEKMENKEKEAQEIYLQMFRKGQKSAEFERQEELAKLATEHPEAVTLEELLEKLHETEDQLTFWQSMRRQESYDEGDKPETEAEVKLRFLRDSMFHFLTDRANAAQHLRAMIGIMGFTEVQMKKINKALVEQKIAEKINEKEKPKPKKK